MARKQNYILPLLVALITMLLLAMVQWKVERPMILLERFIPYGGWIEIPFVGIYAAIIASLMLDVKRSTRIRRISWTVFSVVFFGQLILGLFGFERFLMTGELHLPIPAVILAGPLYRAQIGFMPILFLSTIVLSGPAWCSQLCYFGGVDNLLAKGKTTKKPIRNRSSIKFFILGIVVLTAVLLRLFNVSANITAIVAGAFGVLGLVIILIISRKQGRMIHCIAWCPIGTLVNYGRYINPFRMYIDSNCTQCMACIPTCKYDALNKIDIENGKPGITCTYCGDCLSSCHTDSIKYRFLKLSPNASRNLWIGTTLVLHAVFLALARI